MSVLLKPLVYKMIAVFMRGALCLFVAAAAIVGASAQNNNAAARTIEKRYSMNEIVNSGHHFFGDTSGGLAKAVETVFKRYGQPVAYITGEEGSGAFVGGLTYGEGNLYTKDTGIYKIFWQGPSFGLDFGGQGSRAMILVYNLDNVSSMFGRYGGVAGSAYLVAGVGFNVLQRTDRATGKRILLVPVRTGVGARLGVNFGYLKMTTRPTWNPF